MKGHAMIRKGFSIVYVQKEVLIQNSNMFRREKPDIYKNTILNKSLKT